MHGALHSEQARVWFGSIAAFTVSLSGLEQTLRIALLVVMIAYTVLKFWKGAKSKTPINDTDPPIKLP